MEKNGIESTDRGYGVHSEYTRNSVCQAEEAFGVSMLVREEMRSYSDHEVLEGTALRCSNQESQEHQG